jgi:phosphoglycolate phosphatase-like HAD superfamily hydrolase
MLAHFKLTDIPFVADVFLDTKALALIKNQCSVYVGDHPNDVYAARIASCKSIVTLTGNATEEDFHENQPDLFLKNLVQFAAKPIETLNI